MPTRRSMLVVFAKRPAPGRVKTRLARDIGAPGAAWWFRHQCARLLRRVGRDPRWRTVLAVSPDIEGMQSRVWPRDLPRWAQGQGDLGNRMGRALREMPPGPVIVIGADIPDVSAGDVAGAFAVLGRKDAVIGPATDGGYWLVGLRHGRRAPRRMFRDVRWSTEHALEDTVASLGGLSIGYAATLRDVDRASDL